ncbi:hypothetical protein ACRRTK_017942 [Alexandromys fortis]
MSKSSRLAKSFFTSAASKLPSSKKDDLSSKSKKTSLGEKTERTGSEGNLEKQVQAVATPAPRKAAAHKGYCEMINLIAGMLLHFSFLISDPRGSRKRRSRSPVIRIIAFITVPLKELLP